ncbi:MAG: hypothetical protein Q8O48_08810, partial [Anaerolineales bacterium]|nr:hypothetical protein [Anaerolineales bacterium]
PLCINGILIQFSLEEWLTIQIVEISYHDKSFLDATSANCFSKSRCCAGGEKKRVFFHRESLLYRKNMKGI